MSVGWPITQWHLRRAASKRAMDFRADVRHAMAAARDKGTPVDVETWINETGGDDPRVSAAPTNVERFERHALAHERRRQMRRQLAALEEQERQLRAAVTPVQ